MSIKYLVLIAFTLSLLTGISLKYLPLWISALYGITSIITGIAYARDKSAAISGKWRTPEKTLHFLSLVGGWPGAVIAQERLRHKTQKTSFVVIFWLTVLANLAIFGSFWLMNTNLDLQSIL